MTTTPVAQPEAAVAASSLRVRTWSPSEFAAAEPDWQRLLRRSAAHPLFMSWAWQYHWWRRFGPRYRHEPQVLAAYDDADRLVGIAPLRVMHRRAVKFGLHARRIGFLAGDNFAGGLLTEYQSLVLERGNEALVARALLSAALDASQWDDALFDLLGPAADTLPGLLRTIAPAARHRRPTASDACFVDTSGPLAHYKAALSAGSRRRLFNLRRRLVRDHGEVRLELADVRSAPEYLQQLNALHAERWGRKALSAEAMTFVGELARALDGDGSGDALQLSRLVVAGECRSVLLSFRAGGTECNIQQGFDETFDRRLPLGYIHFGYALERAFADPRVNSYDFLVGRGKHTDYKRAIATGSTPLATVHVVRAPMLKLAFAVRDRWRGGAD